MTAVNWQEYQWDSARWPNFSASEMACKGSGLLLVDEYSMDKLQALRTKLGKPLMVNSAYRSEKYNRKVGGKRNSFHLQAKAFDIHMGNHDPKAFVEAARGLGFRGIGWYKNLDMVHIDTGPPRSWGSPWTKPEFSSKTLDNANKTVEKGVVIPAAVAAAAVAEPEKFANLASQYPWVGVLIAIIALYFISPRIRNAINRLLGRDV